MMVRRWLTTALVVAALIAPAIADRDGFPLATYPMYARSRGEVVALPTATGITATEERLRLSPQIIGDSDDPLIVSALLRDIVAAGSPRIEEFCREIAGRSVEAGVSIDRVELVTEAHNVVAHASDQPSLVSRQVHTTCEVAG